MDSEMLDIAITGGTVLVGAECRPERADVGIADGRVVSIGAHVGAARVSLDATGAVVAPGFVDIHTHSDYTLPVRPQAEAKLRQGVTTDVTGNCGFSPFPLPATDAARAFGRFFEPELAERWDSVAAFAAAGDAEGIGINVAPLIGLGSIRLAVMGDAEGEPSRRELAAMQELLARELEHGAFGASSGLIYTPGSHAGIDELAAMASVVAKHGGVYATHVRNEAATLEAAIEEALITAERAGCALQLSHHKAVGRENWGAVNRTLDRIDAANRDGQDVWVDVYPYVAGSTSLGVLVPPDVSGRDRVVAAIEASELMSLSDLVLALVPSCPALNGRPLAEVAAERSASLAETAAELLETDGASVVVVVGGMSEDDMRSVLRHPRSVIGSDGWVMSTEATPYTHPRSFGCTTRLLARYVRDEGLLSLSEAVRKLAVLPARRIGLRDRGRLEPGMAADVAVLDLERMDEVATFEQPNAHPVGVEHVIVGGQVALEAGRLTGRRAGAVLRRRP
jgi:N-acyl-D-amino-acid deacylase